jgi:hypothetical protein
MKVFFKIALAVVAVAGVTYWLLSKCAWPASKIKDYRRRRQEKKEQA